MDQSNDRLAVLRQVAAIAHMGGLAGLCPNDALVYIRKLTLDYLDYRGDTADRSSEKVRAALHAADDRL